MELAASGDQQQSEVDDTVLGAVTDETVDLETEFIVQSMDTLADLQFPGFADTLSHVPAFSQDPINNVNVQTLTAPDQTTTTTDQDYDSVFERVDACLESKETPFIALQSSDEEAEGYRVELEEASQSLPEEQMSSTECKRIGFQGSKSCYFVGTDDTGFEPCCGTISIADGTVMSIGHLFAASVCNGGAAPCFLSQWLYTYISSGFIQSVLNCLPCTLPSGSCYSETYGELFQACDDDKVKEIVTSPAGLELLDSVGYRGNPMKASLDKKSSILQ
eukprot:gene11065-19926_t